MPEGLEKLFPVVLIFGSGFMLGQAVFDRRINDRAQSAGMAVGLFLMLMKDLVDLPSPVRWALLGAAALSMLTGLLISAFRKPSATA